jgi:hypothetical protein
MVCVVTTRVHSVMFVYKRDCVAGPGFDDGVVEDLVQVVHRTMLACVVKVVMQRFVEECGLSKNKRGRQLARGTCARKGDNMQVFNCMYQSAKCLYAWQNQVHAAVQKRHQVAMHACKSQHCGE